MSANNETSPPRQEVRSSTAGNTGPTPAVYTVFPEPVHGSVNYGFHSSHPMAPPPKYEDVISGKPLGQPVYYAPPPPGLHQHETIPTRVILTVDPNYKYSRVHKGLGLLFMVIFLIAFVTILVKIFGSMRH